MESYIIIIRAQILAVVGIGVLIMTWNEGIDAAEGLLRAMVAAFAASWIAGHLLRIGARALAEGMVADESDESGEALRGRSDEGQPA